MRLRPAAPLVVIEAPAGCGKTHQGASLARDLALASRERVLIITHTHAACGVFAERTSGIGRHVEIRTIDSLIAQIASAYHVGLGLPADISSWTRRTADRHAVVAGRVAKLLARYPMIAAALAVRYPTIICDEHQDSSGDQHAIVMALLAQGARVRIFGDPMQHICPEDSKNAASSPCDWSALRRRADDVAELTTPHRWSSGCSRLGDWTLAARETLKAGGAIDLTRDLPAGITVAYADNVSTNRSQLRLSDSQPAYRAEKRATSLLILTRYNEIARPCRSMFGRRLPLWEGYVRKALDKLVGDMREHEGRPAAIADAVARFLAAVGKGFAMSDFGKRLIDEASAGCVVSRRGKPAFIQELARFLVVEPNHRGVAAMLRRLAELCKSETSFAKVAIDHHSEYWDTVRLGRFDDLEAGLSEITNHRTYTRPQPPAKAISTIHKVKGLQCGSVILMPCDRTTFPDNFNARCLLYVALSRAMDSLLIVASRAEPSPLFRI
jgi:DNA helicase-2/ATP-dependent DNA helicase PcrA